MKTTKHAGLTKIKGTLYEESVRHFFLDLFRYQLGAKYSDDDPVETVPMSSDAFGPGSTYELRVKREGKWRLRRMAVGLIEESSGSKSTCFKVIYDDLLIVKIPPYQLNDFDKYIERINFERFIANRLSPDIECVSPSISAVLGRIPRFSEKAGLTPHQLEMRYIEKLKINPTLQRHLKIGNTFAFFMNLSKHAFFNTVVAKMHSLEPEMQNEMLGNYDTLWNLAVFEKRYGIDNASAFFSINEVLSGYENEIAPLLKQHGIFSSIPTHTKREWLLNYLAQKEVKPESGEIPPDVIEGLKTKLDAISINYSENIEDYKATIKNYVRHKNFEHNKPEFREIIRNLLDLLTKLKQKCVAIRDLKPENIFFASGPDLSPSFESGSGQSAMGLIDFETGVDLQNQNILPQPLLGGTPYYATPSHIFKNKLLASTYTDLPRLLRFQDWYAVIGLIFNIVTGEHLFTRTGKLLPEIRKVKKQTATNAKTRQDFFQQSSRVFWYTADKEFKNKIEANSEALKSISVNISKKSAEMFKQDFIQDREDILTSIGKRVYGQNLFNSKESRHKLIKAPSKAINHWRVSWENDLGVPNIKAEIKTRIINLMRDLERLKGNLAQQTRTVGILENKLPKMTAHQLINSMFSTVYNFMYQKDKMGTASDDLELIYPEISPEESTLIETTLEDEEEEL
jgi:serine/threonine protein kinase